MVKKYIRREESFWTTKSTRVRSWSPFKRYRWKTKVGEIYADKIELKDLKRDDLKEFKRNNTFGTWYDLISPKIKHIRVQDYQRREKKRLCQLIVNRVIDEFLTLLLIELIVNNNEYMFPNGIAKLRVEKREAKRKDDNMPYYYYTMFLTIRGKIKYRFDIGNMYNFKLTERWRNILRDEINNGHTYETWK